MCVVVYISFFVLVLFLNEVTQLLCPVLPKHLHFVHDLCTHNKVAHRIANDNRAQTQLITDSKDCSYLANKIHTDGEGRNLSLS